MSNYNYPNGVIKPPTTSCYSGLGAYGSYGAVNSIVAPRLVTLVPQLFNVFGSKGHSFAHQSKKQQHPQNCDQYLTNDQTCKNEFNQMYSNRRHR